MATKKTSAPKAKEAAAGGGKTNALQKPLQRIYSRRVGRFVIRLAG